MTDYAFRQVSPRRAFEEILDQLEEAIVDGRLSAGDRLPSERDLAAQFGVSRTSVREALRVLEALRIVKIQRGAENGATLLHEPGNAFTYLLKLYLSLQHVSIQSVIDFLIVISCWAVSSAARGAGGPDVVADLERIVGAMEDPKLDALAFHELDAEFHSGVVQASGNEVAVLVLEGCSDTLRRLILLGISDTPEKWDSMRVELAAEHRAILVALQEGDADLAESLMRTHLSIWCSRAVAAASKAGVPLI
ncbi:MAG: GntR family transcriptional regulator, transcriptional repressor for pyruvate dehydrogenase complex [Baekduia sp.]|nr:GntR family transcriptional regulator, transcriptional repressor for pyruvate dehydrogenase complex [Baekduia sp.]